MKKATIICPNCGAENDINAAVCSFCGTTFERGQEREYMEKLDDILEDVDMIDDNSRTEYGKELKQYGKRATKIFITVLIVVAIIAAIAFILGHMTDRAVNKSNIRMLEDEIKFEQQYFDELNGLYDEGKYDELIERIDALYDEKGSSALVSWEHWEEYFSMVEERVN